MWKQFGKRATIDYTISKLKSLEIDQHNERVKQNKKYLTYLLHATLYLGKQTMSFRGHDESTGSNNRGNYRELLEVFSNFDYAFDQQLHGTDNSRSSFKGTSKTVQNDLIDVVDSVLVDQIISEVSKAKYLSIQADETSDISTCEQFSIIIRFVNQVGDVQERFLGFYDVSEKRNAEGLKNAIIEVLKPFGDLTDKIVSQTYDGAAVMSGKFHSVQSLIRSEAFPHAKFVHCYAHKLNLVIRNCSSKIRDVRIYFANIGAFSSFTGSSSKRKAFMTKQTGLCFPATVPTRW